MDVHSLDYSARTLIRLSWPTYIELLLQLLVGNMDQVQLSHFNATAVAAVGNANTVITVVMLAFNVIGLAAMILISQYRGAGDAHSVEQIYSLSTAVNLGLSLVLAGVLALCARPLLALMQLPAALMPEAVIYLTITAAALPFQALMLTFSAFLRADAKMKVIMCITGFVNVCNIGGNAVLINGIGPFPRLGAAGAALSSAVFRGVGMVLMLWAFLRAVPGARISPALLRPFPGALLRRLLGIGLPSVGENLSYNLSQMSCLVFVNLMGAYVVTTRMYASMFASCIYMLICAVAQVGQVLVGYLVGARDFEGANACVRRILRLFVPATLGIAALAVLFARPLYALLSPDPRVVALGCRIMAIEFVLEIGRSFNNVLVRSFQAVGDIRFPVLLGIASQWAIGVALGWVLGVYLGWGLPGLWASFALDENLRGLIFWLRWRRGKWRLLKTV